MKDIQPVQIWKNGVIKTASVLNATIINDNLSSSCTFYWQLFDEKLDEEGNQQPNESIRMGNVDMNTEQYEEWDNSNEQGYEFVANQINVTII